MPSPTQDPTAPAAAPGAQSPHASDGRTRAADDAADPSPADAFRDAGTRLSEMAEYANYFASAQVDRIKAKVRVAGIYAAFGLLGLLALLAFVGTTVVLLCVGIAQMLTAAFGGRAWAGNLVTALLFLSILAAGGWYGYRRLTRQWREGTIKKYAQRQQQQRAQFGVDVSQRARKPTE